MLLNSTFCRRREQEPHAQASFGTSSASQSLAERGLPFLWSWAAKSNRSKLRGITLAHVLSGDTVSPISLSDFEAFLAFCDISVENLQFIVWFQDYRARFDELPSEQKNQISLARVTEKLSLTGHVDAIALAQHPDTSANILRPSEWLRLNHDVSDPKRRVLESKNSECDDAAFNLDLRSFRSLKDLPSRKDADGHENISWPPSIRSPLVTSHPLQRNKISSPTAQAFHNEVQNILATFIVPGARKELSLSSEMREGVIKESSQSSDPDVFLPVYEAIYETVECVSLPRFLEDASTNINRPRQLFWYFSALPTFLLGVAIALLFILFAARFAVPPQSHRAWRLCSVPCFMLSSMMWYKGLRGFCPFLFLRSSRQLRPWELECMDDSKEARAYCNSLSKESFNKGKNMDKPAPTLISPVSASSPISRIAPFLDTRDADIAAEEHSINSNEICVSPSRFASGPAPQVHDHMNKQFSSRSKNEFQRPPIFGPVRVVEDKRIRAVHMHLLWSLVLFGLFWAIVSAVIVLRGLLLGHVEMQGPAASLPSSESGFLRSTSPDSQMTNSLRRANATIDELTATLAKVSRAPSPDPAEREFLHCCCGRADCANTAAWASFQSKLESRLILCAEVGQALLEKHEAYVRRHGLDNSDAQSEDDDSLSRPETPTVHSARSDYNLENRFSNLQKENAALEKKLNTALLNAEIAESSKKAVLHELEETKEALAKLTVNQAKSTGWETRLNAVTQEKDDLRQELDNERHRARSAEAHAVAMKERCIKLQSELSRVYDDLDRQKQSRTELTEEILRDARARLQMVQQQQFGRSVLSDNPEVTQVMESLVAENEALKRDVAELENLLTEAREDVRTLREQVEESRVLPGAISRVSSSSRSGHHHAHSWASSFGQAPLSPAPRSAGEPSQTYRPLTPSTEARSPSRAESRAGSERQYQVSSSPRPRYLASQLNLEVGDRNARIKSPDFSGRKSPRRPLFLLSYDKAVQTDEVSWTTLLAPVLRPRADEGSSSTPSGDIHSESSSLADAHAHASTIAAVVDRINALFSRMTQADARTLSNRLKRQRLAGDVSHLSHTTVSSILSEVNGLRAHFRGVLEDERSISTCTRRDLRALLSLLREMFAELGQMRIALNDIILDPSLAPEFSEAAMDPSKQLLDVGGRGTKHGNTGGWMGPLSKLFGGAAATPAEKKPLPHPATSIRDTTPAVADATLRQKPLRFVPKSGPALAASTTTVNVEFSGTVVGRSVASSSAVVHNSVNGAARSSTPTPGTVPSRSVMDIFAGAPQPQTDGPWVFVASKPDKRVRAQKSTMDMRRATLTRSAGLRVRLPRNVDAIVDSGSAIQDTEEEEHAESNVPDTLLERTLRPRGLSDSSIRTTFLNDGPPPASPNGNLPAVPAPTPISPVPVRALPQVRTPPRQTANPNPIPSSLRTSLLHTFNRAFTVPAPSSDSDKPPASPTSSTSHEPGVTPNRSASPRGMHILPSIAGWAASQAGLDAEAADDFVGSVRDEAAFGRPAWHRDIPGRDI